MRSAHACFASLTLILSDPRSTNLSIRAAVRKPTEYQNDKASFLLAERKYGAFGREFTIARGTKDEDIKASMDAGLLRIEIPRRAKGGEETKKKIQVA